MKEEPDKFKNTIGPISFTCKILDCGVSRNNYAEDKHTVIYNSSDISQYIEFYNCPQNFKYSVTRNPIPAKSSSGLYYSMFDSSIIRGDHYYLAQLYANNIPIGNMKLKTNVERPIERRGKLSYIFQPKLKLSQDVIIVSNEDKNGCYNIKLSNPGLTPLKILHIDFDSDVIQLNFLKKRIRPFGHTELVFSVKKTCENDSNWISKIKIHSNSIKNDIVQILIVGH